MQFHQERQTRVAKKLDLKPLRPFATPRVAPSVFLPRAGGWGWSALALGGITGHSSLHCLDLSESCSWPEALDTKAHPVSCLEVTSIPAVFVLPVFISLTGPHSCWLCGIHLSLTKVVCLMELLPAAPQCHHMANPAQTGWEQGRKT